MTHVLMTYPGMISSVLLCGQLQLSYLERLGSIEFRSVARDMLSAKDAGWADVVFFVRSDSELDLALAKDLKRAGKRLVYVMDDDLLCVPESLSSGAYYAGRDIKSYIRGMIDLCDVFMSPSEVLRGKYGGDKAAAVEEPSCARQTERPARPAQPVRPVRMGFAGSVDRASDFDILLGKVVKNLLSRYNDGITFEFFGAHPQVADECRIRCIPYRDSYGEYQDTMQSLDWDIGLAPMPETEFHACKHYNKFVEYSGFGIAGVYSDTVPYTRIVRDGENGLLCANTPEAWTDAVSRLIDDDALRQRISVNAQRQARTEFSVENTARAMAAALGGLMTYESPDRKALRISVGLRVKTLLRRFLSALRRYGFRLPAAAVRKLTAHFKQKRV